MLSFTREQMVDRLMMAEFDKLGDADIKEMLLSGCTGWNNMPEGDLIQHTEETFDLQFSHRIDELWYFKRN